MNSQLCNKRKQKDKMSLLMSDYQLKESPDPHDFTVLFPGPPDSLYSAGLWHIHVILPEHYPYRSPSIGFDTRIFHPNVDENSGTVCLDVLN